MSDPQPSSLRTPAAHLTEPAQSAIKTLLTAMDKGTAEDSCRYVLTGTPCGVLPSIAVRLQNCPISRRQRWWGMLVHSRSLMPYPNEWDAATMRRLGEVLALLLNNRSGGEQPAALDSFRALATLTELYLNHRYNRDPRSWLDGERCLELLALEGAGVAELVEILFTPFQAERRRMRYTKLLELRGLLEVLSAAPEPTLRAASALPAAHQVRCIQLLQRGPLGRQEAFGHFLVTAILEGTKPVAHAAARALSDVPRARSLLEEQLPHEPSAQIQQRIAPLLHRLKLVENAQADTSCDGSGYLSITGERIVLPPPGPLPPPGTPPPVDFADIDERLAPIDAGPVRTPGGSGEKRLHALELLAVLPATPARYGPLLLELATQEATVEAARARALLAAAPDIQDLILCLLHSPEQPQRVAAASWVRERGDRGAIPTLRAALESEKAQSVRTALLAALTALGDWEHVCGQRQLEEARRRLAHSTAPLQRCLPQRLQPRLTWADGRDVPPELVRWWLVRAQQLHQPCPDILLQVTFDSLEPAGAAQLAFQALSRFVLLDTRGHGEGLPECDVNCEEVVRRLKSRGRYADDALELRGILALLRWANPADTAAVVRTYLRAHTGRRAQCRALLDALTAASARPILELLHELAIHHHAPRVRAIADDRCDSVAQRLGWTPRQFADQAAPTAGLNERGVLKLPCGDSVYTAEMGPDLAPQLRDPQGKTVQRIAVRGGQADSAKKLWRLFRKQLPEIVDKQSECLRQDMKTGYWWPPEHFIPLLRHPILGRLCQLLIFAAVDSKGTRVTFRPAEDDECLNAASEPVDISRYHRIRVAHCVSLSEAEINAWAQHIGDYKLVPLFAQL